MCWWYYYKHCCQHYDNTLYLAKCQHSINQAQEKNVRWKRCLEKDCQTIEYHKNYQCGICSSASWSEPHFDPPKKTIRNLVYENRPTGLDGFLIESPPSPKKPKTFGENVKKNHVRGIPPIMRFH